MTLFILLQIPVGAEFARLGASEGGHLISLSTIFSQAQRYGYELGMMSVGFAGLMLNYVFHKAGLLPRFLTVWGLVGYALFLVGSSLEILGFNMMLMHTIIGGFWELFVGGWLIVKGFRTPIVRSAEVEEINQEPAFAV